MTTKVKHGVYEYNSGQVIQRVIFTEAQYLTTGAVIPDDDTIPQNTEGSELLSATITPKFATSYLRCTVSIPLSAGGACHAHAALFRDSAANALATGHAIMIQNGYRTNLPLVHEELAGSTAATTFKVRVGQNGAETLSFNGAAGSRFFGGTLKATLIVEEIAA